MYVSLEVPVTFRLLNMEDMILCRTESLSAIQTVFRRGSDVERQGESGYSGP